MICTQSTSNPLSQAECQHTPDLNIQLLHPARLELDEAYFYYEAQVKGLGSQFLDDILQAMDRIKAHPDAWPPFSDRTRRCLASKFPYGIIYQVKNDTIRIIAVAHLHRKPGYWRNRINNG